MSNFRIITDMTRDNEKDSGYAGANFIKMTIKMGFKDCKKLIFLGSYE